MVRLACPRCGESNRCVVEEAGQVLTCAACRQPFRAPGSEKTERRAPPPEPAEEPLDELEVVEEPESGHRTRNDQEPERRRRRSPEEREEEGPRPRKKKRKAADVLGPRKTSYVPHRGILLILVVVFAVALFVGLICAILALVGVRGSALPPLAIILIPTGLIGVPCCLMSMSLKVVLHEGGLAHTRFGKRRLIPWDEIQRVYQEITEVYNDFEVHLRTDYRYTLELEDRTRVVYTNYNLENGERLGQIIMERTTEVILPQAVRAYDRGQVVDFGRLGVSQEGLHYGKSLLEWRGITKIKIKNGYISVSKRGKWLKWCNIAAGAVPNLFVFLALVDHIIGVDDTED